MEFVGNIARKTGEPSLLAVEIAKTQKAAEIGKECGLFYVPKVVNFDAEAGIIEFEHLSGLITLFELAIRKDPRLFELLEKTGQALVAIHEKLVLPADMKINLPDEWMDDADNVFIHGDFTGENVCFDKSANRLVILDWSAAPLLGRRVTFGVRYFDIIWFAYYLFYCMPAKNITRWNACRMVDKFLDGYASSNAHDLSVSKFRHFMYPMYQLQKRLVWQQAFRHPWPKNVAFIALQAWIYFRWRAYRPKGLFYGCGRKG